MSNAVDSCYIWNTLGLVPYVLGYERLRVICMSLYPLNMRLLGGARVGGCWLKKTGRSVGRRKGGDWWWTVLVNLRFVFCIDCFQYVSDERLFLFSIVPIIWRPIFIKHCKHNGEIVPFKKLFPKTLGFHIARGH